MTNPDIVSRLRSDRGAGPEHWQDVKEAADEIERLRQERAELLDILTRIGFDAYSAAKTYGSHQ